MVRIKGGTFQMGSDDGAANERPVHEVTVATFDLDITEVTVAAYKKCMADGKCTPPTAARASTFNAGDDTLPANFIDWHHAKLYCEQNGKRLPTEEEWEFAARGTEGRRWAWGSGVPKAAGGCWGRDRGLKPLGPCPVGSYPDTDTPQGVKDMTGNLWEWTSSGWSSTYALGRNPARRVFRGGSWADDAFLSEKFKFELVVRATARLANDPIENGLMVGFRCAKDADGPADSEPAEAPADGAADAPRAKPDEDEKPSAAGGSSAARDCEAYVQCVCDFSEEVAKKADPSSGIKAEDCSAIKKTYGALGAMSGSSMCTQLWTSYTKTMTTMAPIYATQGITVPASCKR
jgi:hypothetical protein